MTYSTEFLKVTTKLERTRKFRMEEIERNNKVLEYGGKSIITQYNIE
jgi:hypothetical protein